VAKPVHGTHSLVAINDDPSVSVPHHYDRRLLADLRERREEPQLPPRAHIPEQDKGHWSKVNIVSRQGREGMELEEMALLIRPTDGQSFQRRVWCRAAPITRGS
jgi:hypothetical protein